MNTEAQSNEAYESLPMETMVDEQKPEQQATVYCFECGAQLAQGEPCGPCGVKRKIKDDFVKELDNFEENWHAMNMSQLSWVGRIIYERRLHRSSDLSEVSEEQSINTPQSQQLPS